MILLEPFWALLGIPALILLVWLLRADFVPLTHATADEVRSRNRMRWLLLITRSLLILLIVVALGHPILEQESFSEGDPEITVLIDNSSSMQVLDTQPVQSLLSELEDRLPLRTRSIGAGERSALGEDVLSLLGQSQNVLLVTDGHVTTGASLADVAAFAGTINATMNAVSLAPDTQDAAVRIQGPEKSVEGVNSTLRAIVSRTHDQPVRLRLLVDGAEIFSGALEDDEHVWQQDFGIGEHIVTAELLDDDAIAANNGYVHTVTSVEKPRLLYVSRKPSGLERILDSLYRIDTAASVPTDLSQYYAVVLNDLPAAAVQRTDALTEFLLDGNGLVVVGGQDSYDFGGYRNDVLETVLPVRVGSGQRTRGGANIVIAIDLSGSTRGAVGFETVGGEIRQVQTTEGVQRLQKALAISVIEELNPSNSVGVLGFVYPQPNSPYGCSGACVVQPVEPLGDDKQQLIDRVAAIDLNGGTSLTAGMEGSFEMLRSKGGSKNIIFISDGISNPEDKRRALDVARTVAAQGGRVYSVQVGDSDDGTVFMQDLAAAGTGAYFHATEANRLSVLFGDPVDLDQGDAFDVFALNQHHFITQDLDLEATLYGYNQVIPKTGSQVLVTNNGGYPVLTVWNYGVGRVASVTGFNGDDLGQLLSSPTSKLLSRTVNWAIGDPERKEDVVIDVPDGVVGEDIVVRAYSDRVPTIEGLRFSPVSRGVFEATVQQAEPGVYDIAGVQYAVNYPREYRRVGFSSGLADDLLVSGGGVFSPDDVDAIIEHVKTLQQMRRVEQVDLRWWFIIAALAVILLEIAVRRVRDLRKR